MLQISRFTSLIWTIYLYLAKLVVFIGLFCMSSSAAREVSLEIKQIECPSPSPHPDFKVTPSEQPVPCVVIFDFDETLDYQSYADNEEAFFQELDEANSNGMEVLFHDTTTDEVLPPPQAFRNDINIHQFHRFELLALFEHLHKDHVEAYIVTARPMSCRAFIRKFFDAVVAVTDTPNPFDDNHIFCVVST